MSVRAALLDERGIYIGIDELQDEQSLTDRHLPQVPECDLPINQYAWVSDSGSPAGGSFIRVRSGMPSALRGVPEADRLLAEIAQQVLPDSPLTREYLDWYNRTVDAQLRSRG